jgi:RNA-binding protein
MSSTALSEAQRKRLRGLGHTRHVLVAVGAAGLTDAVMAELDQALRAHQLVKLRIRGDDREARDADIARVCSKMRAELVQRVGHVALLYRRNPDRPSLLQTSP